MSLQRQRRLVQLDRLADDLARARRSRARQRHHALADGGHLRPAVVVDDRGDDVAAEGRADLQQQVRVDLLGRGVGDVADVQVGAVGGHAGLDRRGDARGQVAAQGRGPVQHDLRPVLLDQRAEHAGVGAGLEMGQPRVVGRVDRVDALGDEPLGHVLDVVAGQHRAGLHAQPVGQIRGLAAELQRHVVQRAVFLFGEDPNFALSIRFYHGSIAL